MIEPQMLMLILLGILTWPIWPVGICFLAWKLRQWRKRREAAR